MTPKNKIVVFDLDDTLYKEEDFLRSAYIEIAHSLQADCVAEVVFNRMTAWWKDGENVFQKLIEAYHLDMTVGDLLTMYRSHIPSLSLDGETKETLLRTDAARHSVIRLLPWDSTLLWMIAMYSFPETQVTRSLPKNHLYGSWSDTLRVLIIT